MIDIILLFLVLIFSILGFFKGFKKEVKSLVTILFFFIFYHFFIDYVIEIISKFIYINDNYYPNLSYQLISIIFIYLVSVFLNFLIMKVFFGFSFFSQNSLLNRFFGIFIGSIKGLFIVFLLILILNNFNYINYLINLDKNSLFLDYFLQNGVQLPYVWNHWNS